MSLSIAVDGPVGAGKTSLCDAVSSKLNIPHLDTGAMYRAAGIAVLKEGADPKDENLVVDICRGITISVRYKGNQQMTLLNGEDVSDMIRTEEVGMAASLISSFPEVRRIMVEQQRKIAEERDILVDGRDICTRVLPNADVKIFLTAAPETRARRRWEQIKAKGQAADFETVLNDLKARDEQDTRRAVDPLRPADDAVIVDTTDIGFEDALKKILDIVKCKTGREI